MTVHRALSGDISQDKFLRRPQKKHYRSRGKREKVSEYCFLTTCCNLTQTNCRRLKEKQKIGAGNGHNLSTWATVTSRGTTVIRTMPHNSVHLRSPLSKGDKSFAPPLNEHICRGMLQLDSKGYAGLAPLVTKLHPQEFWILSKKAKRSCGGLGLATSATKGKGLMGL